MQSAEDMTALETALLVMVPTADPVVQRWRSQYDAAESVGIPAHLTVAYPFKPDLSDEDIKRLKTLFASIAPFTVDLSASGWFGEEVVFLAPKDPSPLASLASTVAEAWPDWPLYGGVHDTYVPHLTIGHNQPVESLQAAEADCLRHLPIRQLVTEVHFWHGPTLGTGAGPWRPRMKFRLGEGH